MPTLAQKILDESLKSLQIRQGLDDFYVVDQYANILEAIETLCKEQLAKEINIMNPDNVEEPTKENTAMPGLIEGCIVHFVLQHERNKGEHRPAIVVKDWKSHKYGVPGMVNLQVFTDCSNDVLPGRDGYDGHLWATSVHYSENKEPGTWHWVEKA